MAKIQYSPPTELHAIAIKAHQLLEAGGGRLSDDACQALAAALRALYDEIYALADAVHSLGAVMMWADQRGLKEAAAQLTELIRVTKPRFQAFNEEVKGDQVNEAEKNLRALEGKKEVLKVQRLGDKAPPGSVSVASLMPQPFGFRTPMVKR
jgi:hypothetical protein